MSSEAILAGELKQRQSTVHNLLIDVQERPNNHYKPSKPARPFPAYLMTAIVGVGGLIPGTAAFSLDESTDELSRSVIPEESIDKPLTFNQARTLAFKALDKAERLQRELYERERQESRFWEEDE